LFEEEDFGGATHHQYLIIHQLHLPHISICNFLKSVFFNIIRIYCETLSLAVKNVNFVIFVVVEAFLGEVCGDAVYLFDNNFSMSSRLNIPYKMVVHLCKVIEKIDKNLIFRYKTTGDKWVTKFIIWHCKIIEVEHRVEFNFVLFNLSLVPGIFAKSSQTKNAVISVANCKMGSSEILRNFFDFNKMFPISITYRFCKSKFFGLKIMHLNY
jgi:hypothetical protein